MSAHAIFPQHPRLRSIITRNPRSLPRRGEAAFGLDFCESQPVVPATLHRCHYPDLSVTNTLFQVLLDSNLRTISPLQRPDRHYSTRAICSRFFFFDS